jgi:hypothetical protein
MSVERCQNAGERYGISEPARTRRHIVIQRLVEGSFILILSAKSADTQGGREYLRAAFRRLQRVRRGRPPKASPKIAEK